MQPRAPFIAHRLFPAVVALWFAVLLGAGFMVLPAPILERIVSGTGISSLIPSAQSPLGATARILAAAIAALVGGVAGFALAWRISATRTEPAETEEVERPLRRTPQSMAESVATRRPLLAKEEFDFAGFDAPFPEEALSSSFLPEPTVEAESEPIAFTEEAYEPSVIAEEPLDAVAEIEIPLDTGSASIAEIEAEAAAPIGIAHTAPQPEPTSPAATPHAPAAIGYPGFVPHPAPVGGMLPSELPLELLGMVQLTERLGLSLKKRMERNRGLTPVPPPRGLATVLGRPELEPRAEQPDELAPKQRPDSVQTAPAPVALRPLAYELDDFGEDEQDHEYDEAPEDNGYSSLIGMKTPPREENPPASDAADDDAAPEQPSATISRPFDSPSNTPMRLHAVRDDTEQALRSALSRLQGFSGAA